MSDQSQQAIDTHWPELGAAGFLMAVGLLVMADSLRIGVGWQDDTPQPGYFPFYIGLCLSCASAVVFFKQLWRVKRVQAVFADRSQLALVWSVFWPMVVYVALIKPAGIYVASSVLIGYFMVRHGRYGVLGTALTALAIPALCFCVFELWFQKPLIKGPLEPWLLEVNWAQALGMARERLASRHT